MVRAKTPEAAIYLRDDVKHLADTAYVEQPSFGELLLNLSRNRPVITIRLIDLTLRSKVLYFPRPTATGTFALRTLLFLTAILLCLVGRWLLTPGLPPSERLRAALALAALLFSIFQARQCFISPNDIPIGPILARPRHTPALIMYRRRARSCRCS